MPWQRPASVPFPAVWDRHVGTRALPSGRVPKFKIQDAPPEMFDEIVAHMCTYFVRDEPLCISTKLTDDARSVEEIRAMWYGALDHKMALVALDELDDGTTRLAGVNVTTLALSEDEKKKHECEGASMKKILDLLHVMSGHDDVFAMHDVTEYLTAYGLSVATEYRGQGLGLAVLRARTPLCKATGLHLTATVFTAGVSQELARRANFEVVSQVVYKEYKDEEGNEVFPGISSKLCVFMALRV